jgi:hypothetical protein
LEQSLGVVPKPTHNIALVRKVTERRLDAAFTAEAPAHRALQHVAVFLERLIIISHPDHSPIRPTRDVEGASLIVFHEE